MAYNFKIIEYPNGEIQIRFYSVPMDVKFSDNSYSGRDSDDDVELDPFHRKRYKEVESFEDLDDGNGVIDAEANRYRNCNRTKQMVFTYSRCVHWEWFVTVTFNKDKVDRYNFDDCSKIMRKWFNNQRRYAPDLQYLAVPEQHKDGAWHFHVLLARTGNMKFIDSGHKSNGSVIYNMIKWQYGFTTATRVKDIHKVAKYIGKYVTKSLCDVTPGRQRYYVSQNIPKPKVTTLFVSDLMDYYNTLCTALDSWGKKIAHVSTTRAEGCYTQVTYFEIV